MRFTSNGYHYTTEVATKKKESCKFHRKYIFVFYLPVRMALGSELSKTLNE